MNDFLPNDEVTWREMPTDHDRFGTVLAHDHELMTDDHREVLDSGYQLAIQLRGLRTVWMVETKKLQKVSEVERHERDVLMTSVETVGRSLQTLTAQVEEARHGESVSPKHTDWPDLEWHLEQVSRHMRDVRRIVQEKAQD